VILAHGGNQHGYSLHLEQGQLVFSVRINTRVTSTTPAAVPEGQFQVVAKLLVGGAMRLDIDGRTVATATAGGLIPTQPIDGLSVGHDSDSAVGTYKSPNPLKGRVTDVRINSE
jgi:hypothetical protein